VNHSGRLDPQRRVVAILANPVAGRGSRRGSVAGLVRELRDHGLEPVLCRRREHLPALLNASGPDIRCVVAAGGDGTLAEVLNRAPGWPVALLPLGNENLVARHFRIGRSGRKLARSIAAGSLQRLDLARANGRLFSLMAGAGFDAEVVHRVDAGRQGNINQLSYAWPLVDALRSYPFSAIDVEMDETGERLRGAMVFVFNLPRYALGLPIAPQAREDDGLLDLCVFQRPGRWNLARYSLAVLAGLHGKLPDFEHRRVRRVRLSSEQRMPLQTDGDPAGCLPVLIEVVPGALSLVLPERCSGELRP
jgi:diacylglycerol kinase family enzyme